MVLGGGGRGERGGPALKETLVIQCSEEDSFRMEGEEFTPE